LVPTLADFECAIRHEQNRTSTSKNRHSCPASSCCFVAPDACRLLLRAARRNNNPDASL
jgi:hypothetical protein